MDDRIVRVAQRFLDSITFSLKEQPESYNSPICNDIITEIGQSMSN